VARKAAEEAVWDVGDRPSGSAAAEDTRLACDGLLSEADLELPEGEMGEVRWMMNEGECEDGRGVTGEEVRRLSEKEEQDTACLESLRHRAQAGVVATGSASVRSETTGQPTVRTHRCSSSRSASFGLSTRGCVNSRNVSRSAAGSRTTTLSWLEVVRRFLALPPGSSVSNKADAVTRYDWRNGKLRPSDETTMMSLASSLKRSR
jgi:hypothetical protein